MCHVVKDQIHTLLKIVALAAEPSTQYLFCGLFCFYLLLFIFIIPTSQLLSPCKKRNSTDSDVFILNKTYVIPPNRNTTTRATPARACIAYM